jgi:hypothetical protein
MAVFTPEQLSQDLKKRMATLPKEVRNGLRRAAHRGRALIVDKTPVDTGAMKNAWRVVDVDNGAHLLNDAPYAGVIEKGARPHTVSAEGRASIQRWVKRKLQIRDDKEAEGIMWAIVKKIEKEGYKGTFAVQNSMEEFRRFAAEEVLAEIQKAFK